MAGQVPKAVKAERGQQLAKLESRMRTGYLNSLHGKPLQVLIEGDSPQSDMEIVGTACRYVPVHLPTRADAGQLINAKANITRADGSLAVQPGATD